MSYGVLLGLLFSGLVLYAGWAFWSSHQVGQRIKETHEEGGCPFTRMTSFFKSDSQGDTPQ